MRHRPALISVIAFFAALAGLSWIVLGARILGFDWFTLLGDVAKFEQAGIWGWLALGVGILWLLIAGGLWALRSWAWLTAMYLAGLTLFGAFLYFLEYPGSGLGFGMSIMPAILLFYLNSARVRVAFGEEDSAPMV